MVSNVGHSDWSRVSNDGHSAIARSRVIKKVGHGLVRKNLHLSKDVIPWTTGHILVASHSP